MYQPFAQGNNRGVQKPAGQVQNAQQPQPQQQNYQRAYPPQNQQYQYQNTQPNAQYSQQVKPTVPSVLSQQQAFGNPAPSAAPVSLNQQNIKHSQQAYYGQQQQQQVPPQRISHYQQQQKAQQYRIVNGTQYSSASSASFQSQPSQQMVQKPGQQQYYQQASTPQNYSSMPSTQTSKSSTMYQAQQQGDRRQFAQQVQQQNQQFNQQVGMNQFASNPNLNKQQQIQYQQANNVATATTTTSDQSLKRLHSSIQQLQIQLQSLTSNYQRSIQLKKMPVEELNLQKSQFRLQIENIYHQTRKVTTEYPTVLCLVTRLPNGEIGIRRSSGSNPLEKEINHLITLIEETYLQFIPARQVQQSLIPVTIQNEQSLRQGNFNIRDSAISTHANLNMKKSTENLKTIIEESREKPIFEKENSQYYSPIIRAYARGREEVKPQVTNNNQQFEDDQEIIHQYGSTQKERLNTSPDVIQTTDRGAQNDRFSYRVVNPPTTIVQASKNPFNTTKNIQRQFTFNDGQTPQARLTIVQPQQLKMNSVTQPDVAHYEPILRDLQDNRDEERVKRANAYSVLDNKVQGVTPNYNMDAADSSYKRLSTVPQPQQNVVYDQIKQAQDFNRLLKDTNQFNLQTTSKDLQKLMDEEKYEQVSDYAYQTLTVIDRQIINMKATVEQALEQTELTMTKNLLLEIIESLRQTVKNKEMDISHRVISKISKNTARLLKDKTASYSLYLYLQKITNFLKERQNILNQSIQANEMSLLNQTDHSFWMNNKIDNNDPNQIMPILENAKKNNKESSEPLNFQFFLRDHLDIPSYVPMKEQQRMVEEVRQSIQTGSMISTFEAPKVRQSVALQSNVFSSNLNQEVSVQKPVLFQNQLIESTNAIPAVGGQKFGFISPPDYVPLNQSKSLERPKSAQSSNILAYRSPVNKVDPSADIFNSNISMNNHFVSSIQQVPQVSGERGNKFLQQETLPQRSSTIPARIFNEEEEAVKKSSPTKIAAAKETKPLNEEFAHQRKLIKTQFAQSPNKSFPIIKNQDQISENPTIVNTPSLTEKKITQIQRAGTMGVQNDSNKNSDVSVNVSNNNYSISHLMTPIGSVSNKQNSNSAQNLNAQSNNTSNLDSILNKYRVGDIEREIQQGQVQNGYVRPESANTYGQTTPAQATVFDQNSRQFGELNQYKEETVKRSAPSHVRQEENRENNPELSSMSKQQSLVMKYAQPQTGVRPALEQVNNQVIVKSYSIQNILKSPSMITNSNNDPFQSVQDKYSVIINQQKESLQRTSVNFNSQQQQKKFYDLALKIKSEYPKTHKANTILVNSLWEEGQTIPETDWSNFIVQKCNSAQ